MRKILFLALTILSLLLTACEQPKDNAINFAIATAPSSLHPTLASDAVSERINALLYRPLIGFDTEQNPVSEVVEWKMLSQAHYQLNLRKNLPSFSNGQHPTVSDVVATINSVLENSASPHNATLAHIKALALLNQEIIDIKLSRNDPRFIEKLHLGLAPAKSLKEKNRLARNPVGNGDFNFVRWRSDGGLVISRRSDHQLIHFEVIPDPTMRTLEMLRGDTHLMQNDLPYEMYDYLTKNTNTHLSTSTGTTFSYLGFNLADPISGNLKIRQAIAYAIDRNAIIQHLFQGQARLANTVLNPKHWASHTGLQPYEYRPDTSRRLLESLGYTRQKPLKISYKTSTDPFRLRIASVLQAQLADVGIELTIHSYEWGTFFSDIKAGRFQLYSLSWVGIRSADIFRYIYHSESLPPNGANRGRYQSEKVDSLIDLAEISAPKRAKNYYQRVQQQIHDDLVYTPLWYENNLLLSRNIDKASPRSDGGYGFLNQVVLRHD